MRENVTNQQMSPQMNGFTKVTDRYGRYLTGREKAAILMSELGSSAGSRIIDFLSTKEIRTINRQMKKLGSAYDSVCDLQVLEETNRFGAMRGIAPKVKASDSYVPEPQKANPVADAIKNNPEALAKVLSQWLSAEE